MQRGLFQTALIVVAFQVACSSKPVIDVFEQNVPESELISAVNSLQNSGFDVRRNEIQPPNFTRKMLIYSPFLDHPEYVDLAREALESVAIEVATTPLANSYHLYSKNNMGLYLSTESSDQEDSQSDFMQYFFGECAGHESSLILSSNRTFSVEVIKAEESHYDSGEWQNADGRHLLATEDQATWFSIAESQVNGEAVLTINAIYSQSLLGQCEFESSGLSLEDFSRIFSIQL